MLSGPLFRAERRASRRGRRPIVFRTVFTIVLVLVSLLIGFVLNESPVWGANPLARPLYFGRSLFIATISIEILTLLFFVPASVGGAIADERQKDTLTFLLLTRLTSIEIVLTKAFARWLPAANLVFTGLPFLVIGAWLAGLEFEAALALLVLLSSSAFMACLSILASAQREQVSTARAQATAWVCGWLLVPIMSILPIRTGSLWGDMLYEMKRLSQLIAPSSPFSLITDHGWYNRPAALSLEGRVALMIGLQALFGLMAVGLAAGRLNLREKNPNWLDPTRGFRPSCGDDPIFWRECELPARRGAGSLLAVQLRHVWLLLLASLLTLLSLLAALLVVAVPIGLLAATIYYGLAAFQEVWEYGYGGSGPFVDRANFNMLIRAGTGLLALFPVMGEMVMVCGRITAERDKKTWDAFLMAPLTGEEILWSKARVALHNIWRVARPLPALWMLGLASGVVTPIGVGLAAIDLLLYVWAAIAMNLYFGLRPGTTAAATSRAAQDTWLLFYLHGMLIFAALASPRDLVEFATWDVRLRWGLTLAVLAVPILTGVVAWKLTWRLLDRFDEWVGRPIASKVKP